MLAGTVLGVIRTLWLAPRVGETLAVLIELPLILAFAWAVCGWLIGRWPLGPGWRQAAIMGAAAFIALITLEFLAASWLAGRPPVDVMAAWASPAGALGLLGQLVFAAFPLLQQRKGAGGVSMERESG
jgi:ABC-type uncharacterized transport system permease subunit